MVLSIPYLILIIYTQLYGFKYSLSNTNNLYAILWFQVFLSNTNNLYTIIWF